MPKLTNLGYNDLGIFTPRVRLSRGYVIKGRLKRRRCRVAYGWKKADKAKKVFKWQVVKGLPLLMIFMLLGKMLWVFLNVQ